MVKNNDKLFAGAGIIVCKPGSAKGCESITVVETAYTEQLSTLIFSLKDVFNNDLDYFNKYEFYGRLAVAANSQLQHSDNYEALRLAVIREACDIAAEMGSHLYFAYGSNMDADQMAYRCPNAVFAGVATIPGYAFELDSEGVATVVERQDSTVYGVLWLISESDEQNLDGYEGVGCGCYRKANLEVCDSAGQSRLPLVYISNRSAHDGVTYRSGYMDTIIKNARQLGFDDRYVETLMAKVGEA